jgi:hypothetical protein
MKVVSPAFCGWRLFYGEEKETTGSLRIQRIIKCKNNNCRAEFHL